MLHSPSPLLWVFASLSVTLCTRGAELTGVLRDNQGNGLTGVTVNASIYLPEGTTQLVATTDCLGRFSMAGESGSWAIDVPARELNARGYFSVAARSLTVPGQLAMRLTTPKIDFT